MKNILYLFVAIILCGIAWVLYTGFAYTQPEPVAPEEEMVMVDTEPLPNESIVGVWRSADDPKFVRTIYENGGYMDTYDGMPEATRQGPWVTFTSENAPEDFAFPVAEGVTYVQLDTGDEALTFSIAAVSRNALILTYLERGGSLSFIRE